MCSSPHATLATWPAANCTTATGCGALLLLWPSPSWPWLLLPKDATPDSVTATVWKRPMPTHRTPCSTASNPVLSCPVQE